MTAQYRTERQRIEDALTKRLKVAKDTEQWRIGIALDILSGEYDDTLEEIENLLFAAARGVKK